MTWLSSTYFPNPSAKPSAPIGSLVITITLIYLRFPACLADTTLLQTNILFRHGDRAPISPVYNTDMNPESSWMYGFGELTDVGKEEQYRLGKFLRSRYTDFIKDHLDVKEIYVRSSDVPRCLISAYSNFAGFYSNSSEGDLELPFMRWQPVPVHSVPEFDDEVLAMGRPCKAAKEEKHRVLRSGVAQQINVAYADFFVWLSSVTGNNITNVDDTWQIRDTSFCEKTHGLPLPAWLAWKNVTCGSNSPISCIGRTVFDILGDMLDMLFQMQYSSPKLHMFYGGPLLQEIKNNFQQMVKTVKPGTELGNGVEPGTVPKYFVYSAHDLTVAAVLSALDIVHPKAPQYTATLLFELYSAEEGEIVRLFYKPYTDNATVIPLDIPGCPSPCKLQEFTDAVEKLQVDDWDVECENTDPKPPNFQLTPPELMVIIVCATIIVVLGLLTLICFLRRRRISDSYMPVNSTA